MATADAIVHRSSRCEFEGQLVWHRLSRRPGTSSLLHSLNYDYNLTRFITGSSILRHELEERVPVLRFHLQLLDFLELLRVECHFDTHIEKEVRWSHF
jgi:hypothetical protein